MQNAESFGFTLVTVNCWGLWLIAKNRETRIRALADALAGWGEVDGVAARTAAPPLDAAVCQELWCKADYETMASRLKQSFPYAHRFHGGCVGSGLAIFSKHPIESLFFLPFQPNGKYWKIHHADWYAAKGVGMARLHLSSGHRVNLLTTHTHVEARGGEYRAHRVAQALALADMIDAVREAAHLTILAGDLNSRPNEELFSLLVGATRLQDAWATADRVFSHPTLLDSVDQQDDAKTVELADKTAAEVAKQRLSRRMSNTGIPTSRASIPHSRGPAVTSMLDIRAGGNTCDLAANSYTPSKHKRFSPSGSRLDYILFCAQTGFEAASEMCCRPLPNRIPRSYGVDCSFSDHEAVAATIKVRGCGTGANNENYWPSVSQSTFGSQQELQLHIYGGNAHRSLMRQDTLFKRPLNALEADAMRIAGTCLRAKIVSSKRAWKLSVGVAVGILAILLSTLWLPSHWNVHPFATVPANLLRLLLGALFFVAAFVHPIITRGELHALERSFAALRQRARGDERLLSEKFLDF